MAHRSKSMSLSLFLSVLTRPVTPQNLLFCIFCVMLIPSFCDPPSAKVSFRACAYNMKPS
uniref:Uncharacterized protein n=1 Tax=Anguilla anguilla TaxID=7936 RepID=A0A0E9PF56_ANGAN